MTTRDPDFVSSRLQVSQVELDDPNGSFHTRRGDLLRGVLRLGSVAAGEYDGRAPLGKGRRRLKPDPAVGSRDDRQAAGLVRDIADDPATVSELPTPRSGGHDRRTRRRRPASRPAAVHAG